MRLATTLAAALLLAALPMTASANLLDDGSLDASSHGTDVTNSDWVLTQNSPDGIDHAAKFQHSGFSRSGGAAGSGGGLWFRSFEGNQGGGGDPLADALLAQSLVAPSSGDYLLTFEAARENANGGQFTAASWDASLTSSGTGGSVSVDLLAASIPPGNFNQVIVGGTGPAVISLLLSGVTAGDTLTVAVEMVDGVDVGGSQSAFVDSFSLTAVPEPTTALLAGLALIGLAARRRV